MHGWNPLEVTIFFASDPTIMPRHVILPIDYTFIYIYDLSNETKRQNYSARDNKVSYIKKAHLTIGDNI